MWNMVEGTPSQTFEFAGAKYMFQPSSKLACADDGSGGGYNLRWRWALRIGE